MCDPLSLTVGALTVGSTILSGLANRRVEKARTSSILAENARQDRLQRASIAALTGTQQNFTPEAQSRGIDEATAARAESLTKNVTGSGDDPVADVPFTASAPKVVKDDASRALATGLSGGRDFARRLARLGAFQENQFNNQVSLGRLGETTGMNAMESRNSAQLLPFELDAANRKGDTLFGIADLLGAGGSALNLAGAVGANPLNIFSRKRIATDAAGRVLGGI